MDNQDDIIKLNPLPTIFFFLTIAFVVYWKYFYVRARENENPTETLFQYVPNNSNVKSIQNPFYIEFDLNKSTLDSGIYFKIKSNPLFKSTFNCMVVWSVNIEEFYKELEKDNECGLYIDDYLNKISGKRIKFEITQDDNVETQIDNDYYYKTPEICKLNHEEQYKTIQKTYPVIVILYRHKNDLTNLSQTDIVASFNIVHLKDKNMASKVLYSYTKLLNNRIMNINKLFAQESDTCVICLTAKSDQVLLPCKHLCTCTGCFEHINNKCPLCREPVYRSFKAN